MPWPLQSVLLLAPVLALLPREAVGLGAAAVGAANRSAVLLRAHWLSAGAGAAGPLEYVQEDPRVLLQQPFKCGEPITHHPKDVKCPAECPYLRVEPTGICEFTCVVAKHCASDDPLASFPDPDTMRCGACLVQACTRCGVSSRSCARCQKGYVPHGGLCYSEMQWFWVLFYIFVGLLACIAVAYVATLALRPTSNLAVFEHAMQYRRCSQMHDDTTGELYPLIKTNVRASYVAGVGALLHFHWQFWAAIYTSAVVLLLYVLARQFGKRPGIMKAGLDNDYFEACNLNVRGQAQQVAHMEMVYFWGVLVIYVASTTACLALAVRQRRLAVRMSEEITSMQDYVLLATGLPKMPGTQPVEEALAAVFQEALQACGAEVVGVSVCWDFRSCAEDLREQVQWELERGEVEREKLLAQTLHHRGIRDTARYRSERKDEGSFSAGLRQLDAIFGVGEAPDSDHIGPEERGPKEVRALLESLYSSGQAYVVFRTEAQRNKAFLHLEANPLKVQGRVVSVAKEDSEPETVLWQHFGIKPSRVMMNLTLGIVLFIFGIFLLDVLFYFPMVAYLLSVSDVVGMQEGGMQGTLLGLLVCVCNQIIYLMISKIADACGFSSTDTHQRFYVVGYTAAVFINTIIDLFVVLLLAHGYTMEQAMRAQTSNDSTMSVKAIADNPNMQMTVYVKYAEYIFPSCLLIPYLLEPVVIYGMFFIKKNIVRSREDVSVQEAELQLQYDPFDLARYGDILVNVMLCVGTLAFTYADIYCLWLYLLLSQIWIYNWDKYRFLRVASRSLFVTSCLDETAQYLSSAPCGLMAACLVFRLYGQKGGKGYGFLEPLFKEAIKSSGGLADSINRDTIVVLMFATAGLHIVCHCYALQKWVPKWCRVETSHDEDVDYAKTAGQTPCNWFNANPVHALRSIYVYEHNTPCLPYGSGRAHLLEANPALGCYYEKKGPKESRDSATWHQLAREVSQCLVEDGLSLAEAITPKALSPKAKPNATGS